MKLTSSLTANGSLSRLRDSNCWRHQLSNRVEDNPEPAIILALKLVPPAREFGVGREHLAQLYKRAHDFDVDQHGAFAVQHAREHRNALLSKNVRKVTPATSSFL